MTNNNSNDVKKNLNVFTEIEVSQIEAMNGASKVLVLENPRKVINIQIPVGVGNGTQLRINGQGNRDEAGNCGNLYLTVKITGIYEPTNNSQKRYEFKENFDNKNIGEENADINEHYKQGIKYFSQNNMQKALEEFKKAKENDPENEEYQIMVDLAQYKIGDVKQKDVKFYDKGLKCLKNEKFDEAEECFKEALAIRNDDLYKEALRVAKNKKINVMESSENILLTVFDKEMVKRILKEREKGKIWYNIDSFVEDVNVQPHELVAFRDKLVFPAKKIGKMVRTVER